MMTQDPQLTLEPWLVPVQCPLQNLPLFQYLSLGTPTAGAFSGEAEPCPLQCRVGLPPTCRLKSTQRD
jgi:hypothetical protein